MNLQIPASWQAAIGAEFNKPYFQSLAKFVDDERRAFPFQIYPSDDQVFAALQLTPFENVRVVLVGQDPYPGEGMAHGLCFSVQPTVKQLPASLKNIFKELQSDLGLPVPSHGCLTSWAEQGVLLLNTILTLRAGQPLSHKDRGWETFTNEVLRQVSGKSEKIVFVLWGKTAQSRMKLIDTSRHVVIESAHPSPLSARAFVGSRPFSKINAALLEAGQSEIDWRIM